MHCCPHLENTEVYSTWKKRAIPYQVRVRLGSYYFAMSYLQISIY